MKQLAESIRDIPDFPKEGIIFKDITTLLADAEAFHKSIDTFIERYRAIDIDVVLGVEARGFIFGAALAYGLETGLVIVRKPGKLPWKTHQVSYELEYGSDTLEIHQDAIKPGQRVLVIDDLLATGGTTAAVVELVRKMGGEVVECAFVIELDFLKGRDKIDDAPVFSLLHF
ncbi:MAG: adenine phosphoribosyltransferase [Candidatus Alcyoniella australis]|nr:adenine phosphoribosyltransferase [Candidatus Alcyoniella australis]